MTAIHRLLLFLLLVTPCCLLVFGAAPGLRRSITKTLSLSNGLDLGSWGSLEFCKDGSFANSFEGRFEEYGILDADETALNALILLCFDEDTHVATGHISSTVGEKGELQGMRVCPDGYLTSVRARVLELQGTFGDDVAVQNFQFKCNHTEIILTAVEGEKDTKIPYGLWSDWEDCPEDSAICSIETRFSEVSTFTDDAAISDATFYCCSLNDTVTTTK